MAKKKSLKSVKAKAWKVFSEYFRKKNTVDDHGECYTCSKYLHWKQLQVGHFVGGRKNAVLFNEDCCRLQCAGCNVFLQGNYQQYTLKMIDEVGMDKVNELLALKNKAVKFTIPELEEMIEQWKGES